MNGKLQSRPPSTAPRRQTPRATAALLLWMGASLGVSAPSGADELSVHGFGTIGAAYVDKPAGWGYSRSLDRRTSTADLRLDLDSLVGIQLNYSPTHNVELVGQATFSRLEDADPVDYLGLVFLAWRPDQNWSLRIGRINLDAYLVSDYRDVGYTHLSVRPPVEFYARMPTSLDGADVMRTWSSGEAQWQAKLYAGTAAGGTGERRLRLWPLHGVTVSRESGGLLLRLSAMRARSADDIEILEPLLEGLRQMQALPVEQVAQQAAQLGAQLGTEDVQTNYLAAAVAYDTGRWLLAAEVNRAQAQGDSAISFTSGYASIGRRFGALSLFVTHSAAIREDDPRQAPDWATPLAGFGAQLAAQAQAIADGATMAINRAAAHQTTTSLGARWDLAPRLAVKTQLDRVHTRRDGDGLWRGSDGAPARSIVLSVAADFVF